MGTLVSQREYARHRGISNVAVHKAVKTGRIRLTDGKVDVELADQEWVKKTDQGHQNNPTRIQRTQRRVLGGPTGSNGGSDGGQQGGSTTQNYQQNRAIREAYLARLAKLEYETKSGRMVDADEVRVAAFNAARKARDMLISMPDRLAPLIAAETNQFEVHRILSEEIRRIAHDISGRKSESTNGNGNGSATEAGEDKRV